MRADEQLSKDFALSEFLRSEMAARMGLDVEPTLQQVANARTLTLELLQPIRDALGRPIVILSGIRPLWLNDLVGGAPGSAHIEGRAADTIATGMRPDVFSRWIRQRDFPVDQVICEFGRWTHIAMAPIGVVPRRQYLDATHVGGRTVYRELV